MSKSNILTQEEIMRFSSASIEGGKRHTEIDNLFKNLAVENLLPFQLDKLTEILLTLFKHELEKKPNFKYEKTYLGFQGKKYAFHLRRNGGLSYRNKFTNRGNTTPINRLFKNPWIYWDEGIGQATFEYLLLRGLMPEKYDSLFSIIPDCLNVDINGCFEDYPVFCFKKRKVPESFVPFAKQLPGFCGYHEMDRIVVRFVRGNIGVGYTTSDNQDNLFNPGMFTFDGELYDDCLELYRDFKTIRDAQVRKASLFTNKILSIILKIDESLFRKHVLMQL